MKRFVLVLVDCVEFIVVTENGNVRIAPISGYKSGISIGHKFITKKIRRKIKTCPLHDLIIDKSETKTTEFPSGFKLLEQIQLPPLTKTLVFATEDEQVIFF